MHGMETLFSQLRMTWILFILVPQLLLAQITFERNYGGTGDDIGKCVKQTSDEGYIICGYTKSFGAQDYDAYIIRTDAFGDTLWSKILGGPGFDAAYSLVITPDNGYLVCGRYFDPGKASTDIWLIRFNEAGDTLWSRHDYSSSSAEAHSVGLTQANGFILTGTREDAGGTGHIFLLETTSAGDPLWSQDYPFWSTSGGNAVIPTNDDGYLICGYVDTYNPTWNRNLGLVKTNNTGDTLWTRQFGGTTYEMGWSVCESATGGYLAAGQTSGFGAAPGDGYLVKTSDAGLLEWQNHFGRSGLDVIYSITNTDDLNYIATGISGEEGSEFQEAWLVKIDQTGDTLWSRSYGGYRKSYGYSVIQTSDAGYLFCGSTNASGTNIYDVYLVKTTSDGLVTSISGSPDRKHQLNIFPNPSTGMISVTIPSGSSRLIITSVTGVVLFDTPVANQSEITLYLAEAPPGIYFVRVENSVSCPSERLVIR